MTLIDEMLFVFASLIFVYGSLSFIRPSPFRNAQGCQLFIVGSLIYLGLAIFAAYEIIEDARLANKSPDPFLLAEQFLYVFGSLLFTIGTYKFTPPLDKSPPLVQAVNDAAANIDAAAGTTLDVRWFGRLYEVFVAAGSAPPEVDEATLQLGDQLFAVGSVFYAIAAFVSALRAAGVNEGGNANDESEILLRRTAIATASLYELGGVAFVVGTLGFVPAGTLGIAGCPDGTRRMETFGASIFVLGSVFYTLGSSLTLPSSATSPTRRRTRRPHCASSSNWLSRTRRISLARWLRRRTSPAEWSQQSISLGRRSAWRRLRRRRRSEGEE